MKNEVEIVKAYYDSNPEMEWNRLEGFSFEFLITKFMMNKYLKPNSKILDIGGGPGRYSLHFANLGHDVTLVDLSEANVRFAFSKASELGLSIKGHVCDARDLSGLMLEDKYDYILIMGPMYHIFKEEERIKVIEEAKKYLKKDGLIFVSFIQLFAGILYYLSECPELLINEPNQEFFQYLFQNQTWTGTAFTEATFIKLAEIKPFMERCGFQTISIFGQEGISSSNDFRLRSLSETERALWLDLCQRLCEQDQYLAMSSHIMYIGKIG